MYEKAQLRSDFRKKITPAAQYLHRMPFCYIEFILGPKFVF